MTKRLLKTVFLTILIFFSLTPQFGYSISSDDVARICFKTAVIGSAAVTSSVVCLLGLIKIFHPTVIIKKEELIHYRDNNLQTSKTQANGSQTNITTTYERPFFNKNEAIQGTCLCIVGLVGLERCWWLAQ